MTATNIVDVINANGGNFTKDDLKNYAAVEAACYFTEYRGKALYLHFLPLSFSLNTFFALSLLFAP